ncbi:2401_t:CDS:2, partial [Funneliformis mosseae]
SLNINNNGMGCDLPIMVVSCNESISASQEERFENFQAQKVFLRELCQNSALDSTLWIEILKKLCKLIFPDNNNRESEDQASMSQVQVGSEDNKMLGLRNDLSNSLMLVEMITCESDICRIASYIDLEIKAKAPLEDLIIYIEHVKWYSFNHIIINGELYCGMLFLDCYSCLFEWNHMEYLLLLLGDYLKKNFQLDPAVAWGTADGFVFEIRIRQGRDESNISRSEHEKIISHFALHSLQFTIMASEPLSTTIANEPLTSTLEIQTDTSEPS